MSKILEKTNKKVLVPELRFKEFEGDWIIQSLSDLLTFKNGLNSDRDKYGSLQ